MSREAVVILSIEELAYLMDIVTDDISIIVNEDDFKEDDLVLADAVRRKIDNAMILIAE